MRACIHIVPGTFFGATIEPGTFHLLDPVGKPCGGRRVNDRLSQNEANSIGDALNIAHLGSAPSEDTADPIPPNTESEANTTLN